MIARNPHLPDVPPWPGARLVQARVIGSTRIVKGWMRASKSLSSLWDGKTWHTVAIDCRYRFVDSPSS